MAEIIDLTEKDAFKMRKLERLIVQSLYHHDPDVLALWISMVTSYIKKYPGVPSPGLFDVVLPDTLSDQSLDQISDSLQQYLQRYIDEVKNIMLEMLGEIILLQKEVAEKRVKEN